MLVLGVVIAHLSGALRTKTRGSSGDDHTRAGSLGIRSSVQIHCSRCDLHGDLSLLRFVRRVVLDHDEGVLLNGVVASVGEDDLSDSFWTGLNHIALIQRQLISGACPGTAVSALDPHSAIDVREMRLLLANLFRLSMSVRRSKAQHGGNLIDESFGLFRKEEVTCSAEEQRED